MSKLNWHTAENPCLLCGVEVTPDSWIQKPDTGQDGIVELPHGAWAAVCDYSYSSRGLSVGWGETRACTECRPVFPPKGWAGKSDAELWEAITGYPFGAIYIGTEPACVKFNWGPGSIPVLYINHKSYMHEGSFPVEALPAAIISLQNAQVLAERLMEVQDAGT